MFLRWLVRSSALLTVLLVRRCSAAPDAIVDQWQFALAQPAADWYATDFDAKSWKSGVGGFGTIDTPGARVGTEWSTADIWLRKSFELGALPQRPALLIHHDEDVEVYLNGRRVKSLAGWTTRYEVVPLDEEGRAALRAGRNLLAVHCRQTSGGQFIDVHVVDRDHVPALPGSQTPNPSAVITPWGESVAAENAWTEYPRPQLQRETWQNLNGRWDYAVAAQDAPRRPEKWDGKILVPFCLESRLGGVQRLLAPHEALWYRRSFPATPRPGRRLLLNFEAVDYRSRVYVNDKLVGQHVGGNTPFSCDVTDAVVPGENSLVVRVEDETEAWQLRGKQQLNPEGIWYTRVSGIWQTVWLEEVAASHFSDVKIKTDAQRGVIRLAPRVTGAESQAGASLTVKVAVKDGEKVVAEANAPIGEIEVVVPRAKLWSPDSPHLYDLDVALVDARGAVVDRVASYAGIRSVGKVRDAQGHWRFTLNGRPLFHWGPLDQGWWPEGLLTPPSDEAMLFDLDFLKSAGFNMIRKHIKVEPRRYYYHCDRLGMLVWQDQVSAGHGPPWTRFQPDPQDAKWPDAEHDQFLREFEQMVDVLENHPSIVVWTAFNEAWGQHRSAEVGRWIAQRDPSRLVNVASGGNFHPVGDVADQHQYPDPGFPLDSPRFNDFVKVVGEFGGHGFPVEGHRWDPKRRNWGYGDLPQTQAELEQRYLTSLDKLNDLRRRGVAAGVYTQTTDVEGEINGLLTYDRRVAKIPAEKLARWHRRLFESEDMEK